MDKRFELLWSSRSPFARKVMIAAHELGVAEAIDCHRVVVSAQSSNEEVMRANPLSQIPTLVLADGTALFDSTVIVDYLNDHVDGNLMPAGPGRFGTLCLHALGDGLMRISVLRFAEAQRETPSAPHLEALLTKASATLDRLDQERHALAPINIATITVAAALAHLDFRATEYRWREGRPVLTTWFETFAQLPSMAATEYDDAY